MVCCKQICENFYVGFFFYTFTFFLFQDSELDTPETQQIPSQTFTNQSFVTGPPPPIPMPPHFQTFPPTQAAVVGNNGIEPPHHPQELQQQQQQQQHDKQQQQQRGRPRPIPMQQQQPQQQQQVQGPPMYHQPPSNNGYNRPRQNRSGGRPNNNSNRQH